MEKCIVEISWRLESVTHSAVKELLNIFEINILNRSKEKIKMIKEGIRAAIYTRGALT